MKKTPSQSADELDMRKQWHELQVSQIELEIQSAALAELELQKRQVEEGLQRYAGLYEKAPVSYLSLSRDGQIVGANRAAAALLHTECAALPGEPFERFVEPASQAALRCFLADLPTDGSSAVMEALLFDGVGGSRIRLEANLDSGDDVIRIIVSDITEWHARETALRRAFVVMDNLDEGVVTTDPAGRILSVNPAFCAITGFGATEAQGKPLRMLRHPRQKPEFYGTLWAEVLAGISWQGELMVRRRDGSEFIASLSLRPMLGTDGEVNSVVAVFSDISQRRQAEDALQELHHKLEVRVVQRTAELLHANGQLRQLSAHMASVKEEERKRIAREIHDELGQNLLALRMDISQMHARVGHGDSRLARRVTAALATIDASLRSVRGIMNELRPAVLDLGLPAALEWLVNDFRGRSALDCRLRMPHDAGFARINAETGVVLFRIVQESLANVLRHAKASYVEVALEEQDGDIMLAVEDNGIGITPQQRDKPGRFGLIGIAERVDALQGTFRLHDYEPGAGARLSVRLPLQKMGT
ncbi:PAS domain S-box protein [Pseudoduganella sp. RAF19]|uniref:PAS domain-containing sensor histidine kinase n=1 Tax=Pseudoduganella sp. RAF19 TaxID=3233052 RepID=UPI003F9971C3